MVIAYSSDSQTGFRGRKRFRVYRPGVPREFTEMLKKLLINEFEKQHMLQAYVIPLLSFFQSSKCL